MAIILLNVALSFNLLNEELYLKLLINESVKRDYEENNIF